MPGGNCAIFGCPSSRRHKGIALFRVTKGKSDFDVSWRKNVLQVIKKDRVIDQVLKKRFEEGDIFICEKHFTKESVNQCKLALLTMFFILVTCYSKTANLHFTSLKNLIKNCLICS